MVLALFGWNWLRAHVPAAARMEASVVFKETVLWFTTLPGRTLYLEDQPLQKNFDWLKVAVHAHEL